MSTQDLEQPSAGLEREETPRSRRLRLCLWLAWLVGCAIVFPAEWARWTEPLLPTERSRWDRLFSDWNLDSTPFLPFLLIAPWLLRRPERVPQLRGNAAPHRAASAGRVACTAIAIGLLGLGCSLWVAHQAVDEAGTVRFGDLPPAYHDEYSYLFQARTFLAGRWSFPSHPTVPQLFDQVHVLNEGKFASRYFPGTGAWMAPFVAWGVPHAGHHLAAALIAALFYLCGRELGGERVGLIAGLLCAASPGMALFSNLLLAHHPTLAGLGLFLAAMLRFMREPTGRRALLAGSGLSYAMLCRPMTAAGFALPFGIWFLIWLIRGHSRHPAGFSRRMACCAAMAAPMAIGLTILAVQNRAITGNPLRTPYQEYTDLYTPRHVYGFNNVTRGEARLGPKVLDSYDRWAENLTPSLAVRNVRNRMLASAQWTLGIVPLAMTIVLFLGTTVREDSRWKWILFAVISLHVVHLPYWFDGIMHWHYVFETAPLLLLITAGVTATLLQAATRPVALGWISLLAGALLTAWVRVDLFLLACCSFATALALGASSLWGARFGRRALAAFLVCGTLAFTASLRWPAPFWPTARLQAAVSELAFARLKYARFESQMTGAAESPALVLVRPDPSDRHIDFVQNDPALTSRVLIGRWQGEAFLPEVRAAFPDRRIYVYRAADSQFESNP